MPVENEKKNPTTYSTSKNSVYSFRPSVQQHCRAHARDPRCRVGRGAGCVDSGDTAHGGSLLLYHSGKDECMSIELITSEEPSPAEQRAVSTGVKTAINQARLSRVES